MKRWLAKATYWVAGVLPRTPQRMYRSADLRQFAGYSLRPSPLAMRLLGLGMRLDAEHWDHWADKPGRDAQKCPECNGWVENPQARTISDGFTEWPLCRREDCGLEVVRPGKAQCWCDVSEEGPVY